MIRDARTNKSNMKKLINEGQLKTKERLAKTSHWIDKNLGWFFTNGNKTRK